MRAYKVVRNENGCLRSAIARDELSVDYRVSIVSYPPSPQLPLLAFDTLYDAESFTLREMGRRLPLEVWECEVILSEKRHNRNFSVYLMTVERLLNRPNSWSITRSWPEGTIFCDSIRLVRKLI